MAKVGRPGKYETHIKPHLAEIKEMCRTMTEAQIMEKLGVGKSAWIKYKQENKEFAETIIKGRQDLVSDLKSTLIQKAHGFTYTEKKTITEEGKPTREETYTKQALPDVAALNLLLKNYDAENWSNDPQYLAIKKEELELQKKKVEQNEWT